MISSRQEKETIRSKNSAGTLTEKNEAPENPTVEMKALTEEDLSRLKTDTQEAAADGYASSDYLMQTITLARLGLQGALSGGSFIPEGDESTPNTIQLQNILSPENGKLEALRLTAIEPIIGQLTIISQDLEQGLLTHHLYTLVVRSINPHNPESNDIIPGLSKLTLELNKHSVENKVITQEPSVPTTRPYYLPKGDLESGKNQNPIFSEPKLSSSLMFSTEDGSQLFQPNFTVKPAQHFLDYIGTRIGVGANELFKVRIAVSDSEERLLGRTREITVTKDMLLNNVQTYPLPQVEKAVLSEYREVILTLIVVNEQGEVVGEGVQTTIPTHPLVVPRIGASLKHEGEKPGRKHLYAFYPSPWAASADLKRLDDTETHPVHIVIEYKHDKDGDPEHPFVVTQNGTTKIGLALLQKLNPSLPLQKENILGVMCSDGIATSGNFQASFDGNVISLQAATHKVVNILYKDGDTIKSLQIRILPETHGSFRFINEKGRIFQRFTLNQPFNHISPQGKLTVTIHHQNNEFRKGMYKKELTGNELPLKGGSFELDFPIPKKLLAMFVEPELLVNLEYQASETSAVEKSEAKLDLQEFMIRTEKMEPTHVVIKESGKKEKKAYKTFEHPDVKAKLTLDMTEFQISTLPVSQLVDSLPVTNVDVRKAENYFFQASLPYKEDSPEIDFNTLELFVQGEGKCILVLKVKENGQDTERKFTVTIEPTGKKGKLITYTAFFYPLIEAGV